MIASDTSDEGTLGDAVYTAVTTKTNITVTTYIKDGVTINLSMNDIKTIYNKVKQEARSKVFRNNMHHINEPMLFLCNNVDVAMIM